MLALGPANELSWFNTPLSSRSSPPGLSIAHHTDPTNLSTQRREVIARGIDKRNAFSIRIFGTSGAIVFQTPKKNLESCWTCRLRHKKCDETRPTCRTCADLGLSCYSSETRPDWLYGGSRQHAVAQRLKAEVKTKARQRRGQKALRRIQANLLDASGSAESHNGPTPPPSTASPILSEQIQLSQQYTTTAASSPSVASSTALLTGPTLPTLSAAHEYEIGLVITYLDHVFPLLFPFYQPQILEGGRTWLLSAIAKNEGVRRSTNSLSSYILCVVPCHSRPISETCLVIALEGVQDQRELTVSHLQSDLRRLNNCEVHDDFFKSTGRLNSIVHLLDIGRTMAEGEEWQIHLRGALGLFEEILERSNRPQGLKWASVRANCLSSLIHSDSPSGLQSKPHFVSLRRTL
ncbi:putative Zn(2)-C6 fungal-type domain-containing protein [Seiridium unicorne]|uniref:Zn(2)-C6 fungal-type domain-containing protein n=1 Tax=Seiridium unicorne TaxID=138068 RepID=A0ABR2V3T6_9PEZI